MPRSIVAFALALLVAACSASPEPAGPSRTDGAAGDGDAVTVEGIRAHLEALQRIADEHGGTRVVGSAGYEASVDYVVGVLGDAGYAVEMVPVDLPTFEQHAATILEHVTPSPEAWTDDVDLRAMVFSGGGDVRARVTRADGGCEASDLAGFPAGDVALLEPGPCLRREQVMNAQEAGASGLIFPYRDTTAGRPLRPTLLYPDGIDVPVLAVTPDVGEALTPTQGRAPTVRIEVDASSTWTTVESVVAQTVDGASDRVVVLGAHLDSVMDGPGINDNGSGVAMLLEIARWLASREAEATIRFAFWAGEEEGLYGSRDYVAGLSEEEVDAIAGYLDLDMMASPNFVRYLIADAQLEPEAAEGDERIRSLFAAHFEDLGLELESVETYGGADHGAFAHAGIPVGGLFAGSAEEKTGGQAARFGGEEGEPMDACYHQACDRLENLSDIALEQFAGAYLAVLTELAGVR